MSTGCIVSLLLAGVAVWAFFHFAPSSPPPIHQEVVIDDVPPQKVQPIQEIAWPSADTLREDKDHYADVADKACAVAINAEAVRDGSPQTTDETGATIISTAQAQLNIDAANAREACSQAQYDSAFAAAAVSNRRRDPYSMTPDIRIAVTGQNPTEISGVTNLPDGTVFAISLIGEAPHCSPTCWIQYPSAVVRNAKFETHLDTSYAPAMPAAYAVDVVTVDPSLEPPAFRNVTGLGGRHLHGPFVAVIDASGHYQSVDFGADPSNVSGRFIHYTQRIVMIPDGEVVKAACLGQENADPSSAGAFGIECGPAQ